MATKTGKSEKNPPRRKPPVAQMREWPEPQKRQIEERAYQLFLERGGEHGYQLNDWLRAEAEFLARKPARTRRATAS